MLALISPAKKLAINCPVSTGIEVSEPELLREAKQLVTIMASKSPIELSKLMSISDKLGQLNHARYQSWQPNCDADSRPSTFLFQGDVYQGLDSGSLNFDQLNYLQEHLRILSGLYGLLRPLDAIYPYRLEMGSKLATPLGSNLYQFWSNKLTKKLSVLLKDDDGVLINLASKEYISAVQLDQLPARVITPVFKDYKNGKYKIISFFAKRARGMMVRYMALHSLSKADQLKDFDLGGYSYNKSMSSLDNWVFIR